MVIRSSSPDLVIPDTCVAKYFLKAMEKWGDKVGIIEDRGNNEEKKYTYEEVRENAMKCGSALYRMGLKKGDVVATCLTNCAEFVFITIGVNAYGAAMATNNPLYTQVELMHQLGQVQPKFVFANSDNYQILKEVCDKLPCVQELICIEEGPNRKTFAQFMANGDAKYFPTCIETSPDDVALILFSSGTTGLPKGVMLTQKNVHASMAVTLQVMSLSPEDKLYMVLPMFHVFGVMTVMMVMLSGTTLVSKKQFNFMEFLLDIQRFKISKLIAVPPMIVGLNQLPSQHGFDLSSLQDIMSGGASLPQSVATSVSNRFNINILEAWGLTEAMPGALQTGANNDFKGSVGKVVPNNFLKVVDTKTGYELGANENGEICLKGPQVMKGYYNNPEATAKALDAENWLHTGDFGHYDDNEFIYIIDRMKELIKYKGFQVAPTELEDVLIRHPKIGDVGVVGVPDIKAGELPKAFVVKKDPSLTEKEIHEFVKGKIAKHKYLRGGITFLSAIPKSATGKILRRFLK